MKKLLFLIVVLALIVGTLASCDLINKLPFMPGSGDNGPDETVETDISEAVKELDDMYAEANGKATENDFELVASINLDNTTFTITWTCDNDSIKVELDDGFWVVDIPENIEEKIEYTLTATITSPNGQNAQVTYNRIVPCETGVISNPVVGQAYKFALLHGNEKKVVYFDGNNYNGYAWYLAYTDDQLAAVDVYLEAVEGVADAYRLYFDNNGEKTYIVAFPRDGDTTKGTLKLDTVTPEEYYTWDTTYNTLVYTSVTGESFYMGSSGTYKSISLSAYSYINGATSYVAHLYGPGGEPETLPEQVLPEVPENYTSADLVDALYKLESGQTLEGPYELTGVITSIKYAYDPAYNNISVNIVVEGREDKPVLCYRLNGGEELKVGDTITVFAGLTNYNGTYETTSGGVIRNVVPGTGTLPEEPEVPSDAKGILDTLYGLADGESVNGSFTLTGKITALDNYNNPTIVVEGFENQPVYCFKLVVSNAIGDVITVTATTMKNYSGTYEFMNCTLVENGGDTPSNPGDNEDSVVLDLTGNANLVTGSGIQNVFAANGITFTNDKAESSNDLTVQASYAQRAYKGSTIKIEYPGMTKIVITFDDFSNNGTTYMSGFDGMVVEGATFSRENDVLTIYFAAATNEFLSTPLNSQVRIEKIEVYTGEVETPDTPVEPETPAYTAPVAGQAYDLFMELASGKVYFNGALDAAKNSYLDTTTDASASVKIYFEVVDGGYHIYFMNGETKTYINAEAYLKAPNASGKVYAGCHFTLGETATTTWTYDTEYGTLEVYGEIEGKSDTFFAGTYGSYSTVSLSGVYYKDQIASGSQYPARIALSEGGNTDTPVDPNPDTPVDPEPDTHEHTFVEGKCECGETDPNYVPETPVEPSEGEYVVVDELKTGDHVLIGAPAYGKLFSSTKTGYYNVGVDYSATNFANVTDAEIWVVTVNEDGSYTFTSLSTGKPIAMADSYSSFNEDGANKSWTLVAKDGATGIFYLKNTVRGNYIEWYNDKGNWSSYATDNLSDLFELSFYVKSEGGNDTPVDPDPDTPVDPEPDTHEHTFVEGKCECGAEDPNYVAPHEHTFVEGKCECGETDPNYVPETPDEPTESTEVVFDFGANGTAGTHADGNDIGTSKEYISGNYTLVLTNALKAFDGGFDKAGNSILKFGTSSVAGTVTFVVPDEVTSVVVYAARYKAYADNNIIVVNGTEYTLSKNSDDGQYEAITIDTTTNKTVTIASSTSATKPRCVVNTIVWVIGEGGSNTPVEPETHEHNYVNGKCECGAEDPNYVAPHEHTFVEGKCECGETDPNYVPETPSEPETPVAGVPEAGKAYIVSSVNANGAIYLSNTVTSGRFNAVTNKDDATHYYVEVSSAGYLLYFLNGDVKNYVVMADTSSGGSITTDSSAATVFEWNSTLNTFEVLEDANARAFATDPSKTYLNFSSYAVSNGEKYSWGQFIAV